MRKANRNWRSGIFAQMLFHKTPYWYHKENQKTLFKKRFELENEILLERIEYIEGAVTQIQDLYKQMYEENQNHRSCYCALFRKSFGVRSKRSERMDSTVIESTLGNATGQWCVPYPEQQGGVFASSRI